MRDAIVPLGAIRANDNELSPRVYMAQAAISVMNPHAAVRRLGAVLTECLDGDRTLRVAPSGIPFLHLKNIEPCRINLQDCSYVDPPEGTDYVAVRPGDVLFTQSAATFRAAVVPAGLGKLAIASDLVLLRPNSEVLPEYLAAVLSSAWMGELLQDLSRTKRPGQYARLLRKHIETLPIPLLSPEEQRTIATMYHHAESQYEAAAGRMHAVVEAIHGEMDALMGDMIEAREIRLRVRHLRDAPWSLSFQRLFNAPVSRPIRVTLTPVLTLADQVRTSTKGLADHPDVATFTATDVDPVSLLVKQIWRQQVEDLSGRMRQPFQAHDVLISTTGAIGNVVFIDEPFDQHAMMTSSTYTLLRFHDTPAFGAIACTHPFVMNELTALSVGGKQPMVSADAIERLLLPWLGAERRAKHEADLLAIFRAFREVYTLRQGLATLVDQRLRQILPT